ncbi:hypothetical protein [Sphingobacterium corticibacter]|uniref:Uncharacterized protein n=1 Tax=Sphingobacterium corticibacter TaxID=2171749 RepID=A0A2T8HGF9_9SPHI|nr:hypothetical protein [Sphingobacterium corticibacter]PVH24531.1 hypothetical protein DC487_13425 [Sphingobacterium corticibacter]
MDFKLFFTGFGFLIVAYLMHRIIRNEEPSSEKANWEGLSLTSYIGLWGSIIMCAMVGVVFIFQSLPAQI